MTLAYAGCRLSEALALTLNRMDLTAGIVILNEKRNYNSHVYRNIGISPFPELNQSNY